MARYYIRCRHCLAVGAVDADAEPRSGVCPCGGHIESMGRVSRSRLVKDGEESVCDHRCTGARGTSCNCKCGGANHGSGALVAVVYDQGPVPRYMLSPSEDRAAEYAVALGWVVALRDRLNGDDVVARKMRGAYLSAEGFRRYRRIVEVSEGLRKVERMRTHAGRLRALRAIGASLTA